MASFTFSERSSGADLAGITPPIAAHPAFPAIVATWFAVLLGLGTLVIPGAMLERLVEASGIAAFVPAAAPPLGVTARALCAGVAAAAGMLLGLALARRIAGGHRADADAPAEKAVRPLAILREIGDPIGAVDDVAEIAPAEDAPCEPVVLPFERRAEAGGISLERETAARMGGPLESLSLDQLVGRLGHAIESRRARLGEAAETAPSVRSRHTAPIDAARPADLQTIRAVPEDGFEPWEDESADGTEASYGSLLSLGNPLAYRDGGETLDEWEGPVPEAPAAELPASTDAALRAALARLQRLSGAA